MDFTDATLVRLAHPDTRRALFDELSLRHILAATYDTASMDVEGPYDAVFDEVRVGPIVPSRVRVDGGWRSHDGTQQVDAHFEVHWPAAPGFPHADATWRGAVIARLRAPQAQVSAAEVDWPDIGSLDDFIRPLPDDPAALEDARRAQLQRMLSDRAHQPGTVSEALIDRLLDAVGVTSVSDYMAAHAADVGTAHVRVRLAEDQTVALESRQAPVAVALIVRDQAAQLSELLAQSMTIKEALGPSIQPRPDRSLPRRTSLIVGWVLPPEVFDDDDWPGAEAGQPPDVARQRRRETAATWLAPAGVALIVPPST